MNRQIEPRLLLRQWLKAGPTDQRVLAKHALTEELDAALAAGDAATQCIVAAKLAAAARAVHAAQAEQRAAMAAALERVHAARDDDMRIAKLVQAFETCALIQVTAEDDFDDSETANRAIAHKHAIAATLDAIGNGRRDALASLLDSPFAGVRASAGAHLLNTGLLRERVIALLQKIERDVAGSAGWTAFWALSPDHHGAWLNETEKAMP